MISNFIYIWVCVVVWDYLLSKKKEENDCSGSVYKVFIGKIEDFFMLSIENSHAIKDNFLSFMSFKLSYWAKEIFIHFTIDGIFSSFSFFILYATVLLWMKWERREKNEGITIKNVDEILPLAMWELLFFYEHFSWNFFFTFLCMF